MRPDLLHEIHVFLTDIIPGLTLGHVKLDPVRKDDTFDSLVNDALKLDALYCDATRNLDMALNRQSSVRKKVKEHAPLN
jgi:hypothetical protein